LNEGRIPVVIAAMFRVLRRLFRYGTINTVKNRKQFMAPAISQNSGTASSRWKRLPFYPFLFPLFPAVSLYSGNIGDTRAAELLPVAGSMLLLAAVLLLFFLAICRRLHKAAILTAWCWIPFFAYGPILDAMRDARGERLVFLFMLGSAGAGALIWAAAALWFFLTRKKLRNPAALLNLFALLMLIAAGSQAGYGLARQRLLAGDAKETLRACDTLPPDAAYPDIYYIIPDSYTRADYLQSAFGYDNTPFLDALRKRGFYIAEKSRSNYPRTQMSLASSMNLTYLDEDLVRGEWGKNLPVFVRQIWDNQLMDFLSARGYEIPAFSSGIAATEIRNENSRFVKPRTMLLTGYQEHFFGLTPLRSVISRIWRNSYANRILYVLEELSRIRRRERPMFVFVHIMAPHLPHQFGADGRPLQETPDFFEGYAGEVEALNRMFLTFIDAARARQPDSIIIIQGDHGPHTDWRDMASTDTLPWEASWEDWVRDKTAILNAYYFPDRDYSALYPEITPVNTFRVVLNQFFGADHVLLPDRSYIGEMNGGGIVEVTEVY
jgi:hypothetical protein